MLGADEVHVWQARVSTPAAGAERCLSPEERSRAARFRFDRDRTRWVASRVFLRRTLARYAGVDADGVELRTADGGKPELVCGSVRFSLAHSGDLAACAVARDREVGVDVERVRDGLDVCRIADRMFAPQRRDEICLAAEPERTERFFAAWTEHEALTKCLGSGLAHTPSPASPPITVTPLTVPDGYAGAVAAAGELTVAEWR